EGLYVDSDNSNAEHLALTNPTWMNSANEEDGSQSVGLSFDFLKPIISKKGGYDTVVIDGLYNHAMPGEPVLPFKTAKILLPEGKNLLSVNVATSDKVMLNGRFNIEPGQKPVPLMDGIDETETNKQISQGSSKPLPYNTVLKNKQDRTPPNQTIYSSSEPFPGKLYDSIGVQVFRGYRILILNLYPVQYIPKTGEIYYFENMDIEIRTGHGYIVNSLLRNTAEDKKQVHELVDNPDAVFTYSAADSEQRTRISTLVNPTTSYDYVILTNNALNASAGAYTFQDLASFKNTQGIATTIVTVENILNESSYWDSNPLFNDTQAIIRNFITDAYMNWGIEYVLLGGDGDGADVGGESGDSIIPVRTLYATAVDGDQGDQIPADMYYGCLDGNWNNDEDSYWGESGEDDLYAEVYVGRAAVDSTTELSNFVMKTLAYENTQDTYLFDVWMVGELLWADPTWGGDYKDEIKDGSSNHGYSTVGIPAEYNVSTLYDRDYPGNDWPKSELIDIIDNNVHIINHLGHANVGYDMKLYNSDADALTNNRYFFGYSQGCYPGSIDGWNPYYGYVDYDCIAEHFTTESHGAFAFIANSRYGWGEAGGTDGPSQHFDREFFDALFGENIREIGKANQDSKEDSIGFISDPIIRWCYYEINLFGDPTVRIKDAVKPEHD
ncbi:MAG: C25 family cysteine peptidase, partial [Thermoplasmatales archaeon]|nr:C25 family cysteine peptidase [Thermoplasmatales archaeon]